MSDHISVIGGDLMLTLGMGFSACEPAMKTLSQASNVPWLSSAALTWSPI